MREDSIGLSVLIEALGLPTEARVDQRVPKKLLLEHGAPTPADKKQIQYGIEELLWVAALKPTNIGVKAFCDEVREYLEIAVVTVSLRPDAKAGRLVELIHRAIPYPTVLVTSQAGVVSVSLAQKRWSQGEANKVVVEDLHQTTSFQPDKPTPQEQAFLASIALAKLPAGDLYSLYQGLISRVSANQAAKITGSFTTPDSPQRLAAMQQAIAAHAKLQRDIAALRAQAEKERQLNRRATLNMEINRLEAQLAEAVKGMQL